MLKTILLIIFFLGFATEAIACSVFWETRKGEFSYERLFNTNYKNDWTYESSNVEEFIKLLENDIDRYIRSGRIFIAKPRLVRVKATSEKLSHLPLALVEFKPRVSLQGDSTTSHWYAQGSEVLTPIVNPLKLPEKIKIHYNDFLNEVESQVKSQNSFEFWDDQIILKQHMVFPAHETSCGNSYVPTFDFNRDYIVLEADRSESLYIPISDDEDFVVTELKKALNTSPKRIRKTISAEYYFSNMKYGIPFKLNSCSAKLTKSNTDGSGWWDPYLKFNQSKDTLFDRGVQFRALKEEDQNKRLFKSLQNDWPALFEYYADRDRKGLECSQSQNFLLFGYQTRANSTRRNQLSQIQSLKGDWGTSAYRFAKIVNGKVLPASIHTNFLFDDYTPIPTEKVMSWISNSDFNIHQWEEHTP